MRILENKLVIYASNVRSYGGATLLQAMIDRSTDDCFFIINTNLVLERYPKNYIRKSGSIFSMLTYEHKLNKLIDNTCVILCLANRPLFFKQNAFVVTFLASVFAIEIPEGVPVSFSRKIKSKIQITLNVIFKRNTDMFLARSQEMVDKCKEITEWRSEYFPFLPHATKIKKSLNPPTTKLNSPVFFYPSDASPHKNHQMLFKAWEILHQKKISANLVVTITKDQAREINDKYAPLNIHPVGYLNEDELNNQYKKADALIFPSLLESFPLAIIEARSFDLAILASEKRFIREHVDPEETFDPLCEFSIASAVTRFVQPSEQYIARPDTSDLFEYIWQAKKNSTP